MERREGSSASSSLPPLTSYPGTSLDLPIPSHTFITGLLGPTTLLDGTNYVTWSAGFRRFLEIHGRLSFLTDDPPSLEDPRFATWITQDQAVTSWLLKMAIPTIAEPMQLLSPSKAIWDEWARMYGYRSNIGRTVEIVEGMFRARQGTRSLQEFYATLRSLLNQLEIYQPYTPDLTVKRRYREETAVGLFLVGIDPTLGAQIRGPILSSITLPTLGEAFSTALRVSSLGPVPTPLLTDSTALSSETRPRRRVSDNDGRGRKGRRARWQTLPPLRSLPEVWPSLRQMLAKVWYRSTCIFFGSLDYRPGSLCTHVRTCGRERGLVWDVRPAGVSTSLSLISLRLVFVAFSPSWTLLYNGIVVWAILLGKHFRSSYSRRDSIPCTKPFDLVHCDVWGPSRVSSPSHFRYYIVFVDDFSRLSWVYLLHDRTDVLSSVRQFLQEISTQYSSTPKILRTDNALEFVQSALQDLCSSRGIIHQTTCPYTSQQNGVAERKHRHLLDMTRTLLIEMGVPHYLWADALLTSAYLLNRLPSSPLGGEVPLHRLHLDRELFTLPPRMFGCVAFVHDHPQICPN
ncbi:uncharacterized protein LOC144714839 [Wolffia australiana]